MTLHEDTLTRRLCVGTNTQRKYNQGGRQVPKVNPLNSIRKPYVYGASPWSLRPSVARLRSNNK